MRRNHILFLILTLGLSFFATSCIKNLEEEGIFYTTQCHGVLIDKYSQTPIEGMKVSISNGSDIDKTVYTSADGSFSININVEQISQGYFIAIMPDSLYTARNIMLDNMSLGIEKFDMGTILIEGPSVPLLSTGQATEVTASSAHCFGSVLSGGNSAVVERGFVYSSMQYPTVENQKVAVGSGEGDFDVVLNLSPNTTYYVRAYARNRFGVGYGDQLTVTTLDGLAVLGPVITTEISATTARCSSSIEDNGGFPISLCGICWSLSANPTIDNLHTESNTEQTTFVSQLTNLRPGAVYYVRAYAVNDAGISYSQQATFTTKNGLPSVITASVSNITSTGAVSGGNVTADGGFPVLQRGVCFSTSPLPTLSGSHTSDGSGSGSFVSHLSGLTPSTTYYYRAYATNAVGTIYGEQFVFVTQ